MDLPISSYFTSRYFEKLPQFHSKRETVYSPSSLGIETILNVSLSRTTLKNTVNMIKKSKNNLIKCLC